MRSGPVNRSKSEFNHWCARRVETYWADLGFRVDAQVVPANSEKLHSVFAVRSDMVDGLPGALDEETEGEGR